MNELPPVLMPGDKITNTWISQLLRAIRRMKPLRGPGISTRVTPDGTVISASVAAPRAAARGESLSPFDVRHHVTADDPDGQWEIYLPAGCLVVGTECEPVNLPASRKTGHDGEAGWYLLPLDETEGPAVHPSGEYRAGYRDFTVYVHAKTSAMMTSEDGAGAQMWPRRRMYAHAVNAATVAGRLVHGDGEANATGADWGDEHRFPVATARVEWDTVTEEDEHGVPQERTVWTRTVARGAYSAPVSVAARAREAFNLVWSFSVAESTGALSLDTVWCVHNEVSAGGIVVTPDTGVAVNVTAATSTIYAKVRTDAAIPTGTGRLEVVCDPDWHATVSDDYVTWLHLYDVRSRCIVGDYRSQSLVNLQFFR